MNILNGKVIKEEKIINLKERISKLDRKLCLAVIQVGNDEASNVYVSHKEKMALLLGCNFNLYKFDDNVDTSTILTKIDELNSDSLVDGILIQMPLPKEIDTDMVQNRVLKNKDVDGLTDINMGLLAHNKDSLVPCTPLGIMELLKYYNISVEGKHVVIVGRSNLVGKPLASLMLNNNATVTVCHSFTKDLEGITKTADILVVAAGKKDLIKKNMVKDNAVVIDVGINRIDGKLYGDVDFDSVKDKVSAITPVPNGVGQMTVLELYNNLYKAYNMSK